MYCPDEKLPIEPVRSPPGRTAVCQPEGNFHELVSGRATMLFSVKSAVTVKLDDSLNVVPSG